MSLGSDNSIQMIKGQKMKIMMRKTIALCGLLCLFLTVNSFAEIITIVDIQEAKNWGDYFLPEGVEPRTGTPPKFLPYYRWDNDDWGWTHTLTFDRPVSEILEVVLEIEAWDVGALRYEVHKLYGNGIYLGNLIPPPGVEDVPNSTWHDIGWQTTKIVLSPEVLDTVMDGTMDMWIDIDANTAMSPGEGCQAVTLRSSKLIVTYTDVPLDKPYIPPDDSNDPSDPPDDSSDDPSDDPNNTTGIYTFDLIKASFPTMNNTGDSVGRIGKEQAWYAFDISSMPKGEEIVAASFTVSMKNYTGRATERTLWYDSDDSWINMFDSDPVNKQADYVVGKVVHSNKGYELVTINIDHDWTNDLNDGYVTLMLSGPENGLYAGGVAEINFGMLELITVSSSNEGNGKENNDGVVFNVGPEKFVKSMSIDVKVPGYSVPSVSDWNNDGLKDLIVGQGGGGEDGKIRVYLNFGTNDEPLLLAWFYVQSEGGDLTCSSDGCLGCFSRVVYWDEDLRKDLLVGQADGTIKIFLNNGTDELPIFDGGTFLQVGTQGSKNNIDVGDRATPMVLDWNNDGLEDLVTGALDGRIHIYINEGTGTDPDYTSVIYAKDNGLDLIVSSGRSSPEVIDLDLDGVKDILTGNTEGQLLFYRNVGTDKAPEFAGYTYVESDGKMIDLAGTTRSRPFVCYWNSDDYLDVLVGADDGKVRLYQELPVSESKK
ncbi:FG-GAP repeat domain-containing protein [Planctomycetota bacterium]